MSCKQILLINVSESHMNLKGGSLLLISYRRDGNVEVDVVFLTVSK